MKKLKIGRLRLDPIILAPMVDVTDMPFRYICKKMGAGLTYTEMIHAEAIIHENQKTKDKMFFLNKEKPLGLQITGKNLSSIKEISKRITNYDLIDLNCGCPSHLTIDHQSGAYLMNSPELPTPGTHHYTTNKFICNQYGTKNFDEKRKKKVYVYFSDKNFDFYGYEDNTRIIFDKKMKMIHFDNDINVNTNGTRRINILY
jgi:hypothetical protein